MPLVVFTVYQYNFTSLCPIEPIECMNSFLLNRAQGSISPIYFHVAQTSRLVQLIEPAPNIHFASSQHVSSARSTTEDGSSKHPPDPVLSASIHDNILYAHGSGVNVLAIDPNEGR